MSKKFIRNIGFIVGCAVAASLCFIIIACSWLVTCGIVYFITTCTGLTYSWLVGTGVWLVLTLLGGFLAPNKSKG